jgi:hypothetical protein
VIEAGSIFVGPGSEWSITFPSVGSAEKKQFWHAAGEDRPSLPV